MSSKHTPGPWLARTAPTSAGLCHIISAADWRGAFLYGDGSRLGVDDALPKAQELSANARLIAAAPDLLEALKGLVAWADDLRREDPVEDLRKARAAISKAEGQ